MQTGRLRWLLDEAAEYQTTLAETLGLALHGADVNAVLKALDRKGMRGVMHPFFG